MDANPTGRLLRAAASGAAVTAWYALPDAVSDRTTRALLKASLLVGTVVVLARQADSPDAPAVVDAPAAPKPAVLLGGVALLGVGSGLSVWLERAIFRRGERRRTEGHRWAHTGLAIAMGAVTAVAAWVDESVPGS